MELGFQLAELLVALAIVSVISTIALPRVLDWTRQLRVSLAAQEIVAVLRQARSEAIRRGSNVGVKFRPGADRGVSFTLHRDGNDNGLRTREIDAGTDPALGPPRRLQHLGAHARFGFPEGVIPTDPGDPGRRLDRLEDPIRFNRSDIASFNPLGASTPGSVYLTDGSRYLAVVRLFGRTGKVKVMWYDPETETWE